MHERQWQDLGHDRICLQLNKDQHFSMHRRKDPPLAFGGQKQVEENVGDL